MIREGAFHIASGRDRTRELPALEARPDAIFVTNGLMAWGALQALEEAGVTCPDDVAVACFDRLDFFELLRPRLTGMVVHPMECAAFVINRISGKSTGPGWRTYCRRSSFSENPQLSSPG